MTDSEMSGPVRATMLLILLPTRVENTAAALVPNEALWAVTPKTNMAIERPSTDFRLQFVMICGMPARVNQEIKSKSVRETCDRCT